jgi:hypothetical protein
LIYNCDKWGDHWYAEHYMRHFRHLRKKKITLLEIGIGGYDDPCRGGNSLRMWKQFFSRAQIAGVDIHDKRQHESGRIRTFKGDQTDAAFLERVIGKIGRPDIVIDDGSHISNHVIRSFEILFPLLTDNGIYVVEDTQTSYWPDHGGSTDTGASDTTMSFFVQRVHGLNYREFLLTDYDPSYFDKHIVSIHFYHNLIFIHKGHNQEQSTRNLPIRVKP